MQDLKTSISCKDLFYTVPLAHSERNGKLLINCPNFVGTKRDCRHTRGTGQDHHSEKNRI